MKQLFKGILYTLILFYLINASQKGFFPDGLPFYLYLKNLSHFIGKPFSFSKDTTEIQKLKNEKKKLELEQLKSEQKLNFLEKSLFSPPPLKNPSFIQGSISLRAPGFWEDTFWIDLGEKTNQQIKKTIVQVNSPVVFGQILVGVIDYVGKNHSRVLLLTNQKLNLSVQLLNDEDKIRALSFEANTLSNLLNSGQKMPLTKPEQKKLMHLLEKVTAGLTQKERPESVYASLSSNNRIHWRSLSSAFSGVGFKRKKENKSFQIIEQREPFLQGDLLITSGLDGIFPKGLLVGRVNHAEKGASSIHRFTAEPIFLDFDKISSVFVLPSQKNSSEEPFDDAFVTPRP